MEFLLTLVLMGFFAFLLQLMECISWHLELRQWVVYIDFLVISSLLYSKKYKYYFGIMEIYKNMQQSKEQGK
jgi:hypothetical protein